MAGFGAFRKLSALAYGLTRIDGLAAPTLVELPGIMDDAQSQISEVKHDLVEVERQLAEQRRQRMEMIRKRSRETAERLRMQRRDNTVMSLDNLDMIRTLAVISNDNKLVYASTVRAIENVYALRRNLTSMRDTFDAWSQSLQQRSHEWNESLVTDAVSVLEELNKQDAKLQRDQEHQNRIDEILGDAGSSSSDSSMDLFGLQLLGVSSTPASKSQKAPGSLPAQQPAATAGKAPGSQANQQPSAALQSAKASPAAATGAPESQAKPHPQAPPQQTKASSAAADGASSAQANARPSAPWQPAEASPAAANAAPRAPVGAQAPVPQAAKASSARAKNPFTAQPVTAPQPAKGPSAASTDAPKGQDRAQPAGQAPTQKTPPLQGHPRGDAPPTSFLLKEPAAPPAHATKARLKSANVTEAGSASETEPKPAKKMKAKPASEAELKSDADAAEPMRAMVAADYAAKESLHNFTDSEHENRHSVDAAMARDVHDIEGQVAELEGLVDSALDSPADELGANFARQLEESRGLRRLLIKDLQKCTMMSQGALNLEAEIKSVDGFKKELVLERKALEAKKKELAAEGLAYRKALHRASSLRKELAAKILNLAEYAADLARKMTPAAISTISL